MIIGEEVRNLGQKRHLFHCDHRVADATQRGGTGAEWRTQRNAAAPEPVPRGRRVDQVGWLAQWNESPQAQEPLAFGLSIVKPCFSMVSTKSIVAPPR